MDPLRPLYLQKLDLCQFRNYTELSIAFSPAINCLTGPNGSGKTNVLDAIHYLAFTRGFRSSQDPQAVQEETSFFLSKAEVMRDGVSRTVECNFVKGKGKKILVNQKPVERLSEHIGQIPLVTVLPQDTDLINGPAEDRRRFLDMIISQYDPAYLRELIRYERALTQRNALIRSFLRAHTWDSEQLELWAGQMLAPAVAIRAGRERFLEEFMPLFESFFHRIVSESETPALAYLSQTTENTPDAWYRQILSANDKDRALGYTSSGIHRDDLQFRINGRTVRHYGSQG
ncbi:MAG: DNA replication and repair protein RecF, partial [Bacteroidetes bacterium]